MTSTLTKLNDLMSVDHVVQVHENGSVTDAPANVWAPSLDSDEVDDSRWTLMNGYSGQFGYSGPLMHASEFVGGRMERDIMDAPGYYVVLANYDGNEWAVAFRFAD